MRKYIFPLVVSFCAASFDAAIAQNSEDTKKQSPFTFEASYIGDGVSNFAGGIEKGRTYMGMANIRLSFSTKDAGLWSGGTLFFNGANTHGGTPSADYIGDFQVASNIEAGEITYLHELWYSHSFSNISITVGVQDLNAEFVASEYAGLFLNSSFGVHSTVATNIPAPIFPLTALGGMVKYGISESIIGKIAVFDGFPDDFDHNPHNLSWKIKAEDGLLFISEHEFANVFSNKLPGAYKIGAYYHNHGIIDATNESISPTKHSNYGFYFIADQTIMKRSETEVLSLFTQASISPESKNLNWYYLGCGLNYSGMFKGRANDVLGLAVAHAGIKNSPIGDETTIELSYRAQLTENIFIQPDFQYVINPAGTDKKLDNAAVGILRFGLSF